MYTPFSQKFDGRRTYFLGCTHFGHINICKGTSKWSDLSRCRDFQTVEEMNQVIWNSINSTVDLDDTLFLLGDFVLSDKKNAYLYRERIKCRNVHLLFGNHEDGVRERKEFCNLFSSVGDYTEIRCSRKSGKLTRCNLFHYPMKVWNGSHHGSFALTSHSHGSLPYKNYELGLDMGWDVFNKPLSFWEVDDIMSGKNWKAVDHHDQDTN
jgi:calcineurin-like phosphoesterase family protein